VYILKIKSTRVNSIEISYTIKTLPISKAEAAKLKDKLVDLTTNMGVFNNVKLNNGIILVNDDIAVLGYFLKKNERFD
jgi:hypothetical protein